MLLNREGLRLRRSAKVGCGKRARGRRVRVADAAGRDRPRGGPHTVAALRELYEETNVRLVTLLAEAPQWYACDPSVVAGRGGRLSRSNAKVVRVSWFEGNDGEIDISRPAGGRHKPEFDECAPGDHEPDCPSSSFPSSVPSTRARRRFPTSRSRASLSPEVEHDLDLALRPPRTSKTGPRVRGIEFFTSPSWPAARADRPGSRHEERCAQGWAPQDDRRSRLEGGVFSRSLVVPGAAPDFTIHASGKGVRIDLATSSQ